MFKIEKNVPCPHSKGKIQKSVDTLHQMHVGDSFVFDLDYRPGYLYSCAKKAGINVKISQIGDRSWRIWRV